MVPVFRTAESMEKTLAKLGNPCDSNLVPVVGSIGMSLQQLGFLKIVYVLQLMLI